VWQAVKVNVLCHCGTISNFAIFVKKSFSTILQSASRTWKERYKWIIFESLLTTFKTSSIFETAGTVTKNCLELKTKM